MSGVKGFSNLLQVKSIAQLMNVKENIKKAFRPTAELEAQNLNVEIEGHKVLLFGSVNSRNELKEEEDAAWSAPEVWQVEK